jgi:hypothetical protein
MLLLSHKPREGESSSKLLVSLLVGDVEITDPPMNSRTSTTFSQVDGKYVPIIYIDAMRKPVIDMRIAIGTIYRAPPLEIKFSGQFL